MDGGGHQSNLTYDSSTCGLFTNGTRFCWGINRNGQLGLGGTTERHAPIRNTAETAWSLVSVGDRHTCGIRTSGLLQCWGANADGQLGLGTNTDRDRPTTVP